MRTGKIWKTWDDWRESCPAHRKGEYTSHPDGSRTLVVNCGSHFAGTRPDLVTSLIDMMKSEPLNPRFEEYGRFYRQGADLKFGEHEWSAERGVHLFVQADCAPDDVAHFWGNFWAYSYGFSIWTDHQPTTLRLRASIARNMASSAYLEARRELNEPSQPWPSRPSQGRLAFRRS